MGQVHWLSVKPPPYACKQNIAAAAPKTHVVVVVVNVVVDVVLVSVVEGGSVVVVSRIRALVVVGCCVDVVNRTTADVVVVFLAEVVVDTGVVMVIAVLMAVDVVAVVVVVVVVMVVMPVVVVVVVSVGRAVRGVVTDVARVGVVTAPDVSAVPPVVVSTAVPARFEHTWQVSGHVALNSGSSGLLQKLSPSALQASSLSAQPVGPLDCLVKPTCDAVDTVAGILVAVAAASPVVAAVVVGASVVVIMRLAPAVVVVVVVASFSFNPLPFLIVVDLAAAEGVVIVGVIVVVGVDVVFVAGGRKVDADVVSRAAVVAGVVTVVVGLVAVFVVVVVVVTINTATSLSLVVMVDVGEGASVVVLVTTICVSVDVVVVNLAIVDVDVTVRTEGLVVAVPPSQNWHVFWQPFCKVGLRSSFVQRSSPPLAATWTSSVQVAGLRSSHGAAVPAVLLARVLAAVTPGSVP